MHFAYHAWFQDQRIAASRCCNIVLFDLNFQTTNEFAPAIRGKYQMELRGARSNTIDVYGVYRGVMQDKT